MAKTGKKVNELNNTHMTTLDRAESELIIKEPTSSPEFGHGSQNASSTINMNVSNP